MYLPGVGVEFGPGDEEGYHFYIGGECVWEGSVGVNMGITSWHLPFWCALCPLAYRGLRAVASIGGAGCWGVGAGTVWREVFVISRWFAFPLSAPVLGGGRWDGSAGSICHLSLVRFSFFGGGAGGWALGL